jgi:hypothetical protein
MLTRTWITCLYMLPMPMLGLRRLLVLRVLHHLCCWLQVDLVCGGGCGCGCATIAGRCLNSLTFCGLCSNMFDVVLELQFSIGKEIFEFAFVEMLLEWTMIVFYACRCCRNSSGSRTSTSQTHKSRQFDTGMRRCAGKQSGRCVHRNQPQHSICKLM